MEGCGRGPVLSKKLWHVVRIAFFMLRKGISKRQLMLDLHFMMKRGKIAGKAIGDLVFHHPTGFSCHSQDPHLAFYTPREYEFSCSNTPSYPFHFNKRSKNHHHHYFSCKNPASVENDVVFNSDRSGVASPAPVSWFGRSPLVRQLRITDSPFPIKNGDEDCHVDREAEEFIEKFYEQLRLQKRMAALEARYYEDVWARRSG